MKRLLVIYVSFVGCSQDSLHRFCPHECYAVDGVSNFTGFVDPETKGVGLCRPGVPKCDENFNIVECIGEVLPTDEVCDNQDNNCDGWVDNSWEEYPLVAPYDNDVCSNLGECGKHRGVCISGEYVCPYIPQAEVCDNLDNDCNGRIDDVPAAGFCFDDEIWKATNGACRAGVLGCQYGREACIGQVLPSIERCDQIDNDCNGIVDDTGDVLNSQYDIVFVIDTSGSMCTSINAVATALTEYVDQFQDNDSFKWAIVGMSVDYGDLVQVIVDFTDIATIQDILANVGCYGAADEASLDSLYEVCSYTNSLLGLSWRPTANAITFSFTDEGPQSYTTPLTDGLSIIDACLDNGVLPFQWSRHSSEFRPIVEGANGKHFMLSNDWMTIFEDLNSIVITLCGA